MNERIPDWAKEMSDEEWEALKTETQEENERLNKVWKNERSYKPYSNCKVCGSRLSLILSDYDEPDYYCYEHCPEHVWQSDYDYPRHCARCGIYYVTYLQNILTKHGIEY